MQSLKPTVVDWEAAGWYPPHIETDHRWPWKNDEGENYFTPPWKWHGCDTQEGLLLNCLRFLYQEHEWLPNTALT
jgi:hypothetical protein